MDRLAESGTRFSNAITPCAICVPARAALATGKYVHQTRHWDNGMPYSGEPESWMHRLKAQGTRVDSIGKLHFRGGDDNGFTHEIEPLQVVEGIGDPAMGIRDGSRRRNMRSVIDEAGAGPSTYQAYDIRNRDNALRWLRDHAADDQPWCLFLSLVTPHPPFLSPPETYALYPHDAIELPPQWHESDWPQHPAHAYMRWSLSYDSPFDEATARRLHAAYYGICTFLDGLIGDVLDAVNALDLRDSTRIIYSSDHGEHLGARGLYGKFSMYDEAVAVPLILSGPDVPAGKVVDTPASLIDCHPTVLEALGCHRAAEDADLPGDSLWDIANAADHDRHVFAEYHAVGSSNASFMLRDRRYKYVYHVAAAPQLFDMIADPQELHDLARNPDAATLELLAGYERHLHDIVDPEATDAQAKADQAARIESLGGLEAVIKRGSFINSPAPGEAPRFREMLPK